MATFFMFGTYSPEATHKISARRTALVYQEIEKLGGRVRDIYALMGQYDLVLIVDLPRMAEAMQASLVLKQLTGISFFTSAAMSVEEFDRLMSRE